MERAPKGTGRPFRHARSSRREDPTLLLAWHGWIGILLAGVAWTLNWSLSGPRTHLLFFPLWLGYVLTVDAWVLRRAGSSLLSRSRWGLPSLFLASVPAWWVFELLNRRLGNWIYLGKAGMSDLEYAFFASLSFSTVIPAVFETAELLRTFRWTERFARGPAVPAGRRARILLFALGAAMLALLLAWPAWFYPLTWLSLFFLLEPLCVALRRPSLLSRLRAGDWRSTVALALGALVCGFFWEMWNEYSFPKWIYDTPGFDFWHVFEMPLLGYLGYLPFGVELHPVASLLLPRMPQVRI